MPPQRPKRLPTDFFDRLLSNQTDDQLNELLTSLVDEQILPSSDMAAPAEEPSVPAMVFEPAEMPPPNPAAQANVMEESIVTEEAELDELSSALPQSPMDDLIPSTPQMRADGHVVEPVEPETPLPPVQKQEPHIVFPEVPSPPEEPEHGYDTPVQPVQEADSSEDTAEPVTLPGADSFEVPPELLRDPRQEVPDPGSPAEAVPPARPAPPPASEAPEDAMEAAWESMLAATPPAAPPAQSTPTPAPAVTQEAPHIYSHDELIRARLNRRWERPGRSPKAPRLAVAVPPQVVDQTKLSALDDYLQTKQREKPSLLFGRIQRAALWFLLPAFIAFSLFSWYPMFKGLALSLFNFQPTGESVFIGVQNYVRAFKDVMFLQSLLHGGLFCGLALLLGFLPPIFLAIFINEFRRGKALLKFLFFLPFLMPTVPAAILWKWIMDQGYGLLNAVISLLPVANPHIGWLTDPKLAMLSIVLLYIWKNTGWAMLIYSASLINIDPTLYEEAEIHGANIWQKVRYITLPTIKGTIAVMFIITIINTVQLFTEVYIMTNGGPMNSTEVLATYIYKQAFFYMDVGYASALSILMLVMLLFLTIFRLRRLDAGG